MIIDVHAHTFPHMGSPSGRDSVQTHMQHIQHHIAHHPQGFRRKRDGELVDTPLFDGVHDGKSGLLDVGLKVSRNGQIEWTYEGEDYYLQWYPVSMQKFESPTDFMIAYLDYVGIDKAVLQHDHVYGELNQYLSECGKKHPDRFIPLAQIEEWNADKEDEIKRLRHAIEELGLKGLYYLAESFFMTDFQGNFDDDKYDDFWKEVLALNIPVFWSLYRARINAFDDVIDQYKRLNKFAKKYPDIPNVVTHGMESFSLLKGKENRFKIFPEVLDCLRNPNVSMEVSFHIMCGDLDYPYPEVRKPLRELCEQIGPEKLMWGSDMPALDRNCTYNQCLNWLRNYCDFISSKDMSLILGDNAARLFDV